MVRVVNREVPGLNRNRYFPSVRSVLLIRFDPGTVDGYLDSDIFDEAAPPIVTSEEALAGGSLQFTQDRSAEAETRRRRVDRLFNRQRFGVDAASSEAFRRVLTDARRNLADVLKASPIDGLSRFIDVQPTSSTRRVNSYRKADELILTIPWKSVPFDARLIRAALVLHYEGTVPAEQWASGQPARNSRSPNATGYLVPASSENLRFIGLADDITDSHGAQGDITTIGFRDLTGILLDTPLNAAARKKVQPGQTIVDVIANILTTQPSIRGLLRGPFLEGFTEAELPRLDPKRYDKLKVSAKEKHRQAAGGRPLAFRNKAKGGDTESYWDAITDLCVSHGVQPRIDLDRLILFKPRTLFTSTPTVFGSLNVPRFPRPGGHREQIGDTSTVRRMVFGSNIKNLSFRRKYARYKTPAIKINSYNPDAPSASQRLITVTHPVIPRYVSKVDASGRNPQREVQVINVQGILDRDQLRDIAEQIYESIGRQELGLTFDTDHLASFSENPDFDPNLDPDLLDIRAGDPLRLLVQARDAQGSALFSVAELNALVGRIRRRATAVGARPDLSDPISFLVAQGFSQEAATQFIQVVASANATDVFRVNGANISFSADRGFTISIDARNYIRVRADGSDPSVLAPRTSLTPAQLRAAGIDF